MGPADTNSNEEGAAAAPAVAVVGMSGRFPGARNVEALWANLRDGVESIHAFSDEALLAAGESPGRLGDPHYVKSCGRLEDIDQFDAGFFGMSPRDAAVFDPQHRLFLECAWEAFEDAGYVAEKFGGPVGVFASSGASEYMTYNLIGNRELMGSMGAWLVRHTGNDPSFLATRVSYELNLRGPSMSVQTACSSSLVAVHLACQSLLNGECDMALAGGATVYPEQNRGYLYKEGEFLSPDGHCRAFDARGAGTVMASAVGCVVLKRLDDALRDGDRVLSVILGSAINNDGSDKVGYLAPSVAGQAHVVREALAVAGVDAADVSYVEAHGTGTLIGDPIEVTALTEAFRATTDRKQFCAIGSLKTNMGHAGEAAGVCGLMKTILALSHRQIPPSLHYRNPNPQLDIEASPFFVNDALRDWAVPDGKRRIAGVTALGAGGTNVHVLVQEPPSREASPGRAAQVLVLSARTPGALDRASENLAMHLRAHPDVPLADVAYTLMAGRKAFACRRAVAATSAGGAADALEGGDAKQVATSDFKGEAPPVVFLFPGGGAQYAGMGAELYAEEPAYRQALDACLSHLAEPLAATIRALLVTPQTDDASLRLESPALALPALFATEYAVARLLESWGIAPAAMIGHSAGEYAAACLAGVLELRDAMALVALRGRLFETLPEGGMLSVALPEDEARAFLRDGLSLAAVNGPSLCVASGPAHAVAEMEAALRSRDIDCARLHIHAAGHSAMVEPILAEVEAFCRTIALSSPRIPIISNLTGNWMTDAEATDPTYWPRHLRGTVRFNDGIQKVLDAKHVLLEVGPGRGLASLARQQPVRPVAMATTLPHPKERGSDRAFLMGALGRLWVSGVALDETKLFAGEERRRVALPSYPFERQRYWVDADPDTGPRTRDEELTKRTDIGEWFYAPSWGRAEPAGRKEATEGRATWLVFTDGSPLAKRLVDGLVRSQDRVVAVRPGRVFAAVDATTFVIDPSNPSDYDRLARELRSLDLVPGRLLHLWSLAPRRMGLRLPLRRGPRVVADYSRHLALDYYSLVFFAQAFAAELDSLGVTVVSSHMQAVPGDAELDPEKAVLLGACKVIPREYPQIACASVDVVYPRSRRDVERLASQLLGELRGEVTDGELALRGADRWVRRFDRVRLPADEGQRDWLQAGGVYLVTGGLGGIGLTVAEHLARHARAKLVLVGRQPLPVDEDSWIATHGPLDETSRKIAQVRAMRDMGAEVMTAAADVGDFDSMRGVMARVHERFGRVNGVFHVAGQLKDEIIALRARRPESPLIDVKMKGAIVLDELVRADRPELFVLFSSVSSILGLPGQADYTAANRFLDAFALARAAQHPATRTLSVDWNAWQGVGLLARSTRLPGTAHPMLAEVVRDEGEATLFRTPLQRSAHWMLAEHVVRGGMALIPGTGLLEIARAALEHRREERAVELRDVVFLAPVAVGPDEPRTLHVRIDRSGDRGFVLYGNSEQETFVTGRVAYVDAPPAERFDLGAIRARCTREGATRSGFLVQHFMDFGPRWGCIDSMQLGAGEALLELALPEAFAADRDVFRLHPAVLDMAVGAAQALLPDFDPTADFYVPLSYGRVLLRRAMPARLFSHVRLRSNGTRHTATFDVTLVDQDLEEIASIEGFVMCRVTPGALAAVTETPSKETERSTRRSESPEEAALRVGMTAPEGMEALDRMLAAPVAPQIVACSLDLDAWLERVAREQRAPSRPEGAVTASAPLFTRPNLGVTFVGPRDPIEHELAAIWRELLGVAEVGVHDDFFELGGQSLVAVRMFHRIGKKFRVELALATLFEAPTIAGCAALLRERLGPSDALTDAAPASLAAEGKPARVVPLPRALRALVTIQAGERGVPFFCVHGAGGNVLNLRDLARAVGPSQPFYGLQAHGVDGATPPHETIEEMASAYVAELREVQSEGPYMLGGYSGGGLVAFEMAQQLTAAGHEVKLLAFIDTFHPRMPLRAMTTRTRLARLRDERFRYVAEAAARPWERLRHASRLRAIEDHRARGEVVPLALREVYMTRRFVNAASRYEPKAWAGRAILFQAEELAYVFRDAGPAYGWHRHVLGGVDVVRVPGDHSTIVLGDNATVIGRELRAALERVAPSVEPTGRVEGAQAPRSRRGEAVAVDSTG